MNNDLLTQTQYAAKHNVSHSAVGKWIRTGKLGKIGDALIQKGKRILIDPLKADEILEANLKMTNQRLPFDNPGDPAATGTPGVPNYRDATAWKAKAEAMTKLLEYDILIGKYILADDVRAAAFEKGRMVRDAVLNIPPRIGKILAAAIFEDLKPLVEETFPDISDEKLDHTLSTLKAMLDARTDGIMAQEIRDALFELTKDMDDKAKPGKRK